MLTVNRYYLAASIYSGSGNQEKGVSLGSEAVVLVEKLFGKHSSQGQNELAFCELLYHTLKISGSCLSAYLVMRILYEILKAYDMFEEKNGVRAVHL